MSIRILVADEQLQEASRILDETAPVLGEDAESSLAVDKTSFTSEQAPDSFDGSPLEKNSPWEILVIALLFFGPGVVLLRQSELP